jgi:uncharacterized protein YdiU (UPF0061 family)
MLSLFFRFPEFIPNTSDDEGRYSFRNQPSIGSYNLEKLLEAMLPLLDMKRYNKQEKRKYYTRPNCLIALHAGTIYRPKLGQTNQNLI